MDTVIPSIRIKCTLQERKGRPPWRCPIYAYNWFTICGRPWRRNHLVSPLRSHQRNPYGDNLPQTKRRFHWERLKWRWALDLHGGTQRPGPTNDIHIVTSRRTTQRLILFRNQTMTKLRWAAVFWPWTSSTKQFTWTTKLLYQTVWRKACCISLNILSSMPTHDAESSTIKSTATSIGHLLLLMVTLPSETAHTVHLKDWIFATMWANWKFSRKQDQKSSFSSMYLVKSYGRIEDNDTSY